MSACFITASYCVLYIVQFVTIQTVDTEEHCEVWDKHFGCDHTTILFCFLNHSWNVVTALFMCVLFTFTLTNYCTGKLEPVIKTCLNSSTARFGGLSSHFVGNLGNTKRGIWWCYRRGVEVDPVPLPVVLANHLPALFSFTYFPCASR